MKIKAKIYGRLEVIIIGFVSAYSHDVKVVYVDKNGKIGSCYLDNVEIIDSEYIPAK